MGKVYIRSQLRGPPVLSMSDHTCVIGRLVLQACAVVQGAAADGTFPRTQRQTAGASPFPATMQRLSGLLGCANGKSAGPRATVEPDRRATYLMAGSDLVQSQSKDAAGPPLWRRRMLGFRTSWLARAASIAAACSMLSLAVTPPATSAESRARKSNVQQREQDARPVYRSRASDDDRDRSSECIGGYRWSQRFYDSNVSAAAVSVPLPCR